MEDSQPYTRLPAPEAHRTSHECLLGCVADWGIYPRPCWVPEGSLAKIFGPVLLCFKPEIDPGTPLDRRGFPGTSLCTKNRYPKLWQPQLLVAAMYTSDFFTVSDPKIMVGIFACPGLFSSWI